MRDIRTDRESVIEAQEKLNLLHHTDGIPLVHPDGIYGDETVKAVRTFQRLVGLPESSELDLATWNALEDYSDEREKDLAPTAIEVFPPIIGYESALGEKSDTVELIQFILRVLSELYEDIGGDGSAGVFDPATEQDIKAFQRYHRLPETGRVDRRTWDELARAYNDALQEYSGE